MAGLRIRIHLIRIQHFGLNTYSDPDPDQIRMQKIAAKKKTFFCIKKYTYP